MPPPEEPVRQDRRVPEPEDDGTFGLDLDGGNGDEDEGGAGSDPSTWTRLDPPVPGCVIYPHGFSVRYHLNLPLEQRLAALARVRWSPGLAPDWRRVGRRFVFRGSVYLTQRAPRFRGRTRWSPLARFNSSRHTVLYHIGIEHSAEETFIELQGVRWADVARFFDQVLQVGTVAVSVCHFLTLERYIVLPQDRAFALAEKHGFVPVGGRAAYSAKEYLIEKVEIPVRVRTRATSKVILSMYRIDRGATSDFKLEARLRGRRRDAQHFTEADCRLLDNILLAFVEDNNLEPTLKPARWEPRDRRSRSESSPVDPDIRALPSKAWRGPAMREGVLRHFSDLHIPRTQKQVVSTHNVDASRGLARIIRTPSSETPLWALAHPSPPLGVRWYIPQSPNIAGVGYQGQGPHEPEPLDHQDTSPAPVDQDNLAPHRALARELQALRLGLIEVVLPHDTSPAPFIEALLRERRGRRIGVGYLGMETWYGVEVLRGQHPLEDHCDDVVLAVDLSLTACLVGRGFERVVAFKEGRSPTGLAYDPEIPATAAAMWTFLAEARENCERTGALMVLFTVDHRTAAGMDGSARNAFYTDVLVRSSIGDAGRYWCHERYRIEARRDDVREVVTLRDGAEGLGGRIVWPGGRRR